ncbi:hypothetical protein NDU88_005697 [Pleurodeles waltl]|uniref:Uncharacterized protein n=1 Tax=Pleurodeles waltl TaxID=8319 RepID=A0AAV7MX80_PLEWA|nr:hypothetical protein NDU88_005697 [Pleurodeles waltl]
MPPEEIKKTDTSEVQAEPTVIPGKVAEVHPTKHKEPEVKQPEDGTSKEKSATLRQKPERIRPLLKKRTQKVPGPADTIRRESTISVYSKRSEDATLEGRVGIHKPAAQVGSAFVPLVSTSVTEPFKTSLSATVKGKEGEMKKADRFTIDPNKQYQTDYIQWKKSLHELISLPEMKASTLAIITGEQSGTFKITFPRTVITGEQDGTSGLTLQSTIITGEQDGISGLRSQMTVITSEQDGISGLTSQRAIITGEQDGISQLTSQRAVITGEQDGISGLRSQRTVITGKQDGISGLTSQRAIITGEQDGISQLTSQRAVITGEQDGISGLTSQRTIITGEQDGISQLTSQRVVITGEQDGISGLTSQRAVITSEQDDRSGATSSRAIINGEQDGISGTTPSGQIITGEQDIQPGITFASASLSLAEGRTRSMMGKQGSLMEAKAFTSERISSEATIILLEQAMSEDSENADIHHGIHDSLQKVALFLPDEHLASLWSDFETMERHLQMLRELITGSGACRNLKLPHLLKLSGTKKEAALRKIFCKVENRKATLESKTTTSWKSKQTNDFHIRNGRQSLISNEEALDSPKTTGQLPPLVSRSGRDYHSLKEEGLLFTGQGEGLKSAVTLSSRVQVDPCTTSEDLLHSDPAVIISPRGMSWEGFQGIIPFLTKIEPLYRKDREEWQSILAWLRIQRQLQSPLSQMRGEDKILRRQPLDMISKEQKVTSASLGQRVLRRMLIGGSKVQTKSPFHHIIPLPWQNNVHTLYPTGESIFGALELDWVTVRHPVFMQSLTNHQLCS